jgi:hypothetical protein
VEVVLEPVEERMVEEEVEVQERVEAWASEARKVEKVVWVVCVEEPVDLEDGEGAMERIQLLRSPRQSYLHCHQLAAH